MQILVFGYNPENVNQLLTAFENCGYIAETKLEVIPDTGDFSVNVIVVYAGIMLLALLAGVVVFFEEKKRRI